MKSKLVIALFIFALLLVSIVRDAECMFTVRNRGKRNEVRSN